MDIVNIIIKKYEYIKCLLAKKVFQPLITCKVMCVFCIHTPLIQRTNKTNKMMTIPMPKLNMRVLSIYVTSLFESKKHSSERVLFILNLLHNF